MGNRAIYTDCIIIVRGVKKEALLVKRRELTYVALALVAASGLVIWLRAGHHAEVRCSPTCPHAGQFMITGSAPIYLQRDSKWADDVVGGSGEKLRSVGCTICCISMALAYHGLDFPPGVLNRGLKENGGYTARGWVKWDSIRTLTSDSVRIRIPKVVSHDTIVMALRHGSPVIVEVLLKIGIPHWVLAVGWKDGQYLVLDPMSDGVGAEPLSKFGSDILGMRIVEKTK